MDGTDGSTNATAEAVSPSATNPLSCVAHEGNLG